MDELMAAAAAAVQAEEGANPSPDDDFDPQRGEVMSDLEEGPDDPDEEEDALRPGELDAGGEDEEQPVEEAAAAAAEAADAPGGPTEQGARNAPELPPSLSTLKVDELKEHLRWRGQPLSGNKPELLERLEKAVAEGLPVLESLGERAARAAAPEANEWEALDSSKITRPVYTGEAKFVPKPGLGFTPYTHPFEYMSAYYPKAVRDLEVENSTRYRHHLAANFKEIYPNAKRLDTKTNSLAHAILICQGLHPVPSQRDTLFRRSFAYKGSRAADLMTKTRWLEWKAFFHISAPGEAPTYGTRAWDELHKVRPMLDAYLKACVDNVVPGRKFSIDEITIGFQGHHARLKQRCGKFIACGRRIPSGCYRSGGRLRTISSLQRRQHGTYLRQDVLSASQQVPGAAL